MTDTATTTAEPRKRKPRWTSERHALETFRGTNPGLYGRGMAMLILTADETEGEQQ